MTVSEQNTRDVCDICGEIIEIYEARATDGNRIFHPQCWLDEPYRGKAK